MLFLLQFFARNVDSILRFFEALDKQLDKLIADEQAQIVEIDDFITKLDNTKAEKQQKIATANKLKTKLQ